MLGECPGADEMLGGSLEQGGGRVLSRFHMFWGVMGKAEKEDESSGI